MLNFTLAKISTFLTHKKGILIDIGLINPSPFTTQVSLLDQIVSLNCLSLLQTFPISLLLLQFPVSEFGKETSYVYDWSNDMHGCSYLLSHKDMLLMHLAVPTWIFPKVLDKFQPNFKQSSHTETQVCSNERQSPFQGEKSSKIVKNYVNTKLSCYTFSSRNKFGAKYSQV